MRAAASISAVVLASALAASAAPAQRATVGLRAHTERIVMDTVGQEIEMAFETGRVYHATVVAFESMKIPVTLSDSGRGLVGNLQLIKSGSLGGAPFTRWINCGSTMTGPRAATYRITMPIVAMLDATGPGKSRVRIALVAQAQDMQGASTEPVLCSSSGALEKRLQDTILKHLIASSQ